jgi:hypothetical protein
MDDDRITVMASKINNYWGDQELGRDMKWGKIYNAFTDKVERNYGKEFVIRQLTLVKMSIDVMMIIMVNFMASKLLQACSTKIIKLKGVWLWCKEYYLHVKPKILNSIFQTALLSMLP